MKEKRKRNLINLKTALIFGVLLVKGAATEASVSDKESPTFFWFKFQK